MRNLALVLSLALGITSQAQAAVVYIFFQTSFTPSVNSEGPSGFVLRDMLVVTDAELASGLINQTGNCSQQTGCTIPAYNLQIGPDGLLSGVVNGVLDRYDFRLTSQGSGIFSGTLTYGDRYISDCERPGCSISGFYAAVPEPVSMVAFGAGLLGLAFARHRQAT